MKNIKIKLATIEDIRNFVSKVAMYEADMDLKSGRYVVDAKSIMGIFSLDLLSPIDMEIHADGEKADKIAEDLKAFIVE